MERKMEVSRESEEEEEIPGMDVDDIEIAEREGKQFRFANQRALLTYRTHLNKEEYKKWMTKKAKSHKIGVLEIAHETGDRTNKYPHTHVVVDFGRTFQGRQGKNACRVFDFISNGETIHPRIKKLRGVKALEDALRYISKEDPECAHLRRKKMGEGERPKWYEKVEEAESELEAMRCAPSPEEVMGAVEYWRLIQRRKRSIKHNNVVEERKLVLRPWQIELEKIPKSEGCIYWVWDHFGVAGKTRWMLWLSEKRGDEINWATIAMPKSDLNLSIKRGWDGTLMIYDYPRCERQQDIYKSIELVRSSRICDPKHGVKSPNIYVLTYFLPDVHKLAKDRWKVYAITHNYRDYPAGPQAVVKEVNGTRVEERTPDMRLLTPEEIEAYREWVRRLQREARAKIRPRRPSFISREEGEAEIPKEEEDNDEFSRRIVDH